MEPPRGWGPPPWSPAPKADALSLALCLLLLGSPRYTLAMPLCKEEEYPAGDECCPKCSPGTYTAHLNGLSECLPCRVCDAECSPPPVLPLLLLSALSLGSQPWAWWSGGSARAQKTPSVAATKATSVSARRGTTVSSAGPMLPADRARGCRREPSPFSGTEWQDTVCEDCQPGTFSPNGTLGECQPWTKCSGPFETEVKPGTSSTDVTCSSRGLSIFVGVLVGFVFCGLVVFGIRMKIRRAAEGPARVRVFSQWKRRRAEWEVTAAQAQQLMPDVTTVAVEETASMFTERDQHAGQQPQVQPSEKSQTAPAESCQALKG
ncbi:tumor necrosis factor receptor superfamily member 14 isoform X2 [Diceros bicornis minor]|uniref:tumor necrosis factor receptor superfamily member 14 isoform X2 n=1 Tax=Diceros bicornis minor TaxID=77932 RepID=UPI0026F27B99|nr:tumor necrosis factor receptor superfamily member 14 isoform X2 [Diceros bicornis minor]